VRQHEARKVSLLLLGTEVLDRSSRPLMGERRGTSGALISGVFRLPVTLTTALAWGHAATRAVYPEITSAAMRRFVTRPIRARYGALPGEVLQAAEPLDVLTAIA
jgi:hypothetical protein